MGRGEEGGRGREGEGRGGGEGGRREVKDWGRDFLREEKGDEEGGDGEKKAKASLFRCPSYPSASPIPVPSSSLLF